MVKATALDPKNVNAHLALAALDFQESKLPSALAHVDRVLASGPSADAYFVSGRVHAVQQKWPEAVRDLRKAIELAPEFNDAHVRLAEALQQGDTKDLAGAREALHRALLLHPDAETLEKQLRQLYAAEGFTAKEASEYQVLHGFPADRTPIVQKQTRTVAVLPFAAVGEGSDEEFGHGAARAVQLLLDGLSGLAVRSGDGAKGQGEAEMGRSLGVEAVLSGTSRLEGDTLSLTARLVDSTEGTVLQTAEVQGPAANAFGLFKDLAVTIAYGYVRLSIAEESELLSSPETALATVRAVGRARAHHARGKLEPARLAFEAAKELDPVYVGKLDEATQLFNDHEQRIVQAEEQRIAQARTAELIRLQEEAAAFDGRFFWGGTALTALGAGAAAYGIFAALQAQSDADAINDSTTALQAQRLRRSQNDNARLATTLLVGGGVGMAVGGFLVAVGLLRAEEPTLPEDFTVGVSVTSGAASSSVSFSW
ncbi:MAG: hypothetical protein V3T05_00095 [Myxococcota bacterium]